MTLLVVVVCDRVLLLALLLAYQILDTMIVGPSCDTSRDSSSQAVAYAIFSPSKSHSTSGTPAGVAGPDEPLLRASNASDRKKRPLLLAGWWVVGPLAPVGAAVGQRAPPSLIIIRE